MKAAGLFLAKFADLKPLNFDLKLNLIRIVQARTGINLTPELIEVKHRGIYLKLAPAYRQNIFIQREQIVADLSAALRQPARALI